MRLLLVFLMAFSAVPAFAQLTDRDIQSAQKVMGLSFDRAERDSLAPTLEERKVAYEELREFPLPNSVSPAMQFQVLPVGFRPNTHQLSIDWGLDQEVKMPANPEALAFYSVADLSVLIKTRQISSVALTKIYLDRLKRYGDTLHCVVTLTEEWALARAALADNELASGIYRGPLHGIPYGVKDLLSTPEFPTTWGATPYQDQMLDETATVVRKLDEAGAVMVAKLSMGALAWGDVWFGGLTRNPWNLEQGASGSSAGSASATAAGLVAFSIGTETLGSIVSPSNRCATTGLRPTYGRVSRYGAMALSWSMDKIGPICRNAEDCALVFDAIRGSDPNDLSLTEAAFNYRPKVDLAKLRVGYLKSDFEEYPYNRANDSAALAVLQSLGATLLPMELPSDLPIDAMVAILNVEAATAFDVLTRSNHDSLLVRQIKNAWPNVFRAARFVPAVEYLMANRARTVLQARFHAMMQEVDVLVVPSFGGSQLVLTNLTGHPCVVVPDGERPGAGVNSICFLGNLFDEATILAVAKAYQEATEWEELHPPMFTP
ncbi:MAG: amidase [Bacteroidia bacterium]|nr:amidase [Bacteroidia bacterium]